MCGSQPPPRFIILFFYFVVWSFLSHVLMISHFPFISSPFSIGCWSFVDLYELTHLVHRAWRQKPPCLLSSFHFCSICVYIFLSFFLISCVRRWKILFIFLKKHFFVFTEFLCFSFVSYSISFCFYPCCLFLLYISPLPAFSTPSAATFDRF